MKRIKKDALEAVNQNKQLLNQVNQLEKQLEEFKSAFQKNPKVQELKGRLD